MSEDTKDETPEYDGHTVALPPTREQAMAYLQSLADDCTDGDQAYAVLAAPPEVLAAAMGGTVRRTGYPLVPRYGPVTREHVVIDFWRDVLPPQEVEQ